MERRFDQQELEEDLSKLSHRHRVAFCASVCERLLPHYIAFSRQVGWGDPMLLRNLLDEVWRFVTGESPRPDRLSKYALACDRAIPHTEDHTHDLTSAALDAATAICETLKCTADGDVRRCGEIGGYGRDTVDMYVQLRDGIEASDPTLEARILADPLMQQELAKQASDLKVLAETKDIDSTIVEQLRGNGRGSLGIEMSS